MTMDITIKKQAFEYLLTQMLLWGEEMNPIVHNSAFTRLKVLKLLFFTAAIKNEQGQDLLDVFDNFYALPNGPVESDIYNCITSDNLTFYSFKDFSLSVKKQYNENELAEAIRTRIDIAVSTLKQKNRRLVQYSAVQLVELSHSWFSWQSSIQIARVLGKGSYRMDVNRIRLNQQLFTI